MLKPLSKKPAELAVVEKQIISTYASYLVLAWTGKYSVPVVQAGRFTVPNAAELTNALLSPYSRSKY